MHLVHRHKRKWPEPKSSLILEMHTTVHSHQPRQYHAEITITFPVKGGTDYFTFGHTASTERAAIRRVIEVMESSSWFHFFRQRDVRFKVTGVLENLYRGYL